MSTETATATGMDGKKVFFLHPSSVIQQDMISELIRNEYEIYLLKDHEKAITLFKRYPDSVVFINIDEGMKEPQWEEYIQTLQNDPDLAALQIGIMTYNNDPELAQKYLMDLMVSGGFIKLSLGLKESTAIVLKVLEANEAKGRRKFLRVRCGDKNSTLNLKVNEKMITGTVMDLSSVGMACTLEPLQTLAAHALVENIQLRLKGTLCLVSGIAMGIRHDEGKTIYVMLFDPKTPPDTKTKIRNFMQWALQAHIDAELEKIG